LFNHFKDLFQKQFASFLPKEFKLILAVSGGIDSVVMVDLIHQLKIPFCIAHCNFQLRNDESVRDENFVRTLAANYEVEIYVKSFSTEIYAAENKLSIQVAARNLRYNWFRELQHEHNHVTTYIVTAHHLNDNIETTFINFCRGTGVEGLTGIDIFDKERKIIRPLLSFSKKELLEYATNKGLQWVEDSSNALNKYTRNSFRNQILPLIEEQFPQFEQNVQNNIQRFNDVAFLYQKAILTLKRTLLKKVGEEYHLSILSLKKSQPLNTIIWEIFKEFNFTTHQVSEIIKLLDAYTAAHINSSTHRILKNRNWLIVSALSEPTNAFHLIQENDKLIIFEQGKLRLEKFEMSTSFNLSTTTDIITLDAQHIKFPLLLRRWKTGDYFYPLGMRKKQKLSRFFINQKLSQIQKERVWVLESNKKIIWVVGMRIDDRFKITPSTKNILKITYEK